MPSFFEHTLLRLNKHLPVRSPLPEIRQQMATTVIPFTCFLDAEIPAQTRYLQLVRSPVEFITMSRCFRP
jgi:hypothetical protein